MWRSLVLGLAAVTLPAVGMATETQTYTYDAVGRLTKVDRSGDVNHNVDTTYTIDDADNRTQKSVTGAASFAPAPASQAAPPADSPASDTAKPGGVP